MLSMLKRMANRAQHLQVFWSVIVAIAVFVVHTQNFRVLAVAASHAARQQTSSAHVFSHGRKLCFPHIFLRFVNACFRAIFAFCRRRAQKLFVAVQTSVCDRAFLMHSFVVTRWAAVLSFICAASNVRKNCLTDLTCSRNLHSYRQRHTLSAAKLSAVFSIVRYCKLYVAVLTRNCVPNSGAQHATH